MVLIRIIDMSTSCKSYVYILQILLPMLCHNQSINHPFTLRGWRPWRPVRVEQPNSRIQTSRQPFEDTATIADGD
jgi:hypothetical protein